MLRGLKFFLAITRIKFEKGGRDLKHLTLIGEMAKRKVTIEAIAECLNTHRNTVSYKLNEGAFYVEEACRIRDTYFPDWEIKDLFRRE